MATVLGTVRETDDTNYVDVDEDITIEEYFQICGQQIQEEFNEYVQLEVKRLTDSFAAVKEDLLQTHASLVTSNNDKENVSPDDKNCGEIEDKSKERKPKHVDLEITIRGGPYDDGKTYLLKPRFRAPCFLGRSTSKKFREKGMSLPRDFEMSTTHGKFEVKNNGVLYYTDLGSTNGSFHENRQVEPEVSLELKDGMVLQIGAGNLHITFKSVY
uniref:FHA domain-containing protein n=1 Tax=Corethron hystrix TaxID=216773 RepID=A0A7S1FRI1_9STRA|mmetsp:Transcript_25036/g.57862  ORF Transcript_25036/g.57862 Transcript_25036/m.57862 type:complete len:214 (+) Transcript_25036:75-716(+)|eukprot:CAMPEP_0113301254 /NCGR_PEP_ID=MMETSP0010_2-20120614/2561_1 /TAXON_ID=216773 ORGANISM="Corethron hystrix, Strain 308" /NCGR_SAMPLE_ID=MMETSP0010_2 /ASSEMBLY_ACC=CAM_ASM_000155 /LENGTH=213 /DNA_ID=CAMNT_0000154849 /DNA_START=71 /DNA_END=712 /DNA_ORIENTATION=+ /assembly_acc=CAM_ASM_000155